MFNILLLFDNKQVFFFNESCENLPSIPGLASFRTGSSLSFAKENILAALNLHLYICIIKY